MEAVTGYNMTKLRTSDGIGGVQDTEGVSGETGVGERFEKHEGDGAITRQQLELIIQHRALAISRGQRVPPPDKSHVRPVAPDEVD